MLFKACVLSLAGILRASSPTISHTELLLPQDPSGVFTLSTSNGCFNFSTDRPDLIKLTPSEEDPTCVTQTTISVNPNKSGNVEQAVVFASETSPDGSKLRCEVLVSSIARVDVTTHIRRLSVGTVRTLQVLGYDRFGNVFSSLEGLEFEWYISDDSILSQLPLRSNINSALSPYRLRLEDSGKQSDTLLVLGRSAGKASLSVSYKSISSQSVQMSIVEPFTLSPSTVNIPVCGSGDLKVFSGQSPVSLPNKAFSFGVPSAVRQSVIVDSEGIVRALSDKPLQTIVTVTDTRTDDNEQSSRICVAEPVGISLVTRTLFPIINSSVLVEIVGDSKDCGSQLFLGGEEVDLSFSITEGIQWTEEKKSLLEITVPAIPGRIVKIDARLNAVQRDSTCVFNSTSETSVVITAVNPVETGIEGPLLVPESQKLITVPISGGSGEYSVISKSGTDCRIAFESGFAVMANCVGSITIADKHNIDNSVSITIEVAAEPKVSLLTTQPVETFIGSMIGFEEIVVASNNEGSRLYNCSSMIESVLVTNLSIANVVFRSSITTGVCGVISIDPLIVGETLLEIQTLNPETVIKVPLRVHSSFAIESDLDSLPVIAVNSSLEFKVVGGSLSHLRLRADEGPIEISRPWIADVVSDPLSNKFRIVCRTEGKAEAKVAHTSGGGIEFECVDVSSIGILGAVDSNVFVTCGHDEPHTLRVVGFDAAGRLIHNMTSLQTQIESSVGSVDKTGFLAIASMECATDQTLGIKVRLANDRPVMIREAIVKARDTVRATMGPQLSNSILSLPCEFTNPVSSYSVQFLGGSGAYSLESSNRTIFGKKNDLKSIMDPQQITLGDLGLFSVLIPAASCNQSYEFRLLDEALAEPLAGAAMNIRTLPVERVEVAAPSVVVAGDWFELTVTLHYLANTAAYDSVSNAKYFALTESVFGWSVGGGDFKSINGRIFARINSASDRTVLTLSARIAAVPAATVAVAVLQRAKLLPVLPQGVGSWIVKPGAPVQDLLADGIDVDHLRSLGVRFQFSAIGKDVEIVSKTSTLVEVKVGDSGGAVLASLSTDVGEPIYNLTQPISVKTPAGLRINGGNSLTILLGDEISLFANFVDQDHHAFFPPHQLSDCEVKWSLYGSLPGQAIRYRFSQLGSIPVKVLTFCPNLPTMEASLVVNVVEDLRIKPIANLVTGSVYEGLSLNGKEGIETPSAVSVERVELSASQFGAVTYRNLHSSILNLEKSERPMFVSETRIVGHVDLRDEFGQRLVFPDNLSVIAGSGKPGIVELRTEGDAVIATALAEGCATIFVYFRTDLVGIESICSKFPVLPGGIIVSGSTGAVVRFLAGQDTTKFRIPLEMADSIKASACRATKVNGKWLEIDSELVPGMASNVTMTFPLKGQWSLDPPSLGTIKHSDQGLAVVEFNPSKTERIGFVIVGNIHVPVMVKPIARLEVGSPLLLVHKQGLAQKIFLTPVASDGTKFSESGLVDQRFEKKVCEIDRPDMFIVSSSLGGCLFEPLVVGAHRTPLEVKLTVTVGSFAQTIAVPVENHFRVVYGPYLTAISESRLSTPEESVELLLTNPTDDLDNCQVKVASKSVTVTPINTTGQFKISRTSPRGNPDTNVRVECGIQSLDFVIGFPRTAAIVQESFVVETREKKPDSLGWYLFGMFAKFAASVGAMIGIARLYMRRVDRPVVQPKRHSAPPEFAPLPHPDRDLFINRWRAGGTSAQ